MHEAILVVEDDAVARMALTQTVASAGYRVSAAESGEEAIGLLASERFDLVLTDLRLPGANGIDVLRAATTSPAPPAVLLLTGYSTVETAVAALRLGAADYLLKPAQPQALLGAIVTVLRRRAESLRHTHTIRNLAQGISELQRQLLAISSVETAGSSAPFGEPAAEQLGEGGRAFGPLYLGRYPHEARFNGLPLHLTPIEHTLLHCLAEAAGEVVTYTEVVRRTHGYSTGSTEAQAMLKTHVRNLRRKTSPGLIQSIRHTGYRLSLTPDDGDDPAQADSLAGE
jgi:DNA-binding response OmpR family regulator